MWYCLLQGTESTLSCAFCPYAEFTLHDCKSPDHCCFHTAWLSEVAFSCWHLHIARWIADRFRYSTWQIFHGRLWFSQIESLIIHAAWLSLVWMSTDLTLISVSCLRFCKTCQRVKIGAKIMQCELGITHQLVNKDTLRKCEFFSKQLWITGVLDDCSWQWSRNNTSSARRLL